MRREIILPPHLYDRIKASAGEHGGIGWGVLFSGGGETELRRFVRSSGVPVCAHGHAWGTCTRKNSSGLYHEPTLEPYFNGGENDRALERAGVARGERVPFERWCNILNVKRAVESPRVEAVASVVDCELAVD